jgi:hypothetical protein
MNLFCHRPQNSFFLHRLRMALEIWDEDMAEAEGVVTITKTTISTTVIKTTEVVPILLERHSLATRLRLSSSNHSHPQLLTNSHLSRARQMAHEDSPWAEGSRKCLQPVHPLINLNLEFGHEKWDTNNHSLSCP